MEKEKKILVSVPAEIHRMLKIQAIKEGITLRDKVAAVLISEAHTGVTEANRR